MRYLIVLIILISSVRVFADTTPSTNQIDEIVLDLKGIKSQVIPVNGVNGVWFNATDADKILHVLQDKIPHAIALIKDQDLKLETFQFAIDRYKTSNDSLMLLSESCNKTVNDIIKMKVPSEATPFYKEPQFMFISGMVLGAAVTVGLIYVSTNVLSISLKEAK